MQTTEENDIRKEVERTPFSPEAMRVRCPNCRKLYLVQMSDVREDQPRFECVQCRHRFWLNMVSLELDSNGEVTGLSLDGGKPASSHGVANGASAVSTARPRFELHNAPAQTPAQPCPKCFKLVTHKSGECPHCGIMMDKVRELAIKENLPPHSEALARSWQKVIADYGDESSHVSFIREAQRENALAYAATQYGQLSALMPADETTRRHIREVQALASVMIPSREETAPKPRIPYARVWQVPLAAAVLMILVGLFLPVFRNMVGVGAAIFFIAIALRLQQR